jgi:ubiquinone/menaquinone biosynthesis C-methylase UbiE
LLDGVHAVGIDLNPYMLSRAHSKLPLPGRSVTLLPGDAQIPPVKEATFDALVFNLILSVIPDGRLCLQENLRALKPNGCRDCHRSPC